MKEINYLTVADLLNDPFSTPTAAKCESCGDSALKAYPPEVAPAAGVQYRCAHCCDENYGPPCAIPR